MKKVIPLLCVLLIFVSCLSLNVYDTAPPKNMIKLDKVETTSVNSYWLTKPAIFSDYQLGQASIVDSKYYSLEVQLIGKIVYSPNSFFETDSPTELYVGYNEKIGYIYGFVFMVDSDLIDKKKFEKINEDRDKFIKYYESIKPADVSNDILNSYKEVKQQAAQANLIAGSKIFLNLSLKYKTSGGTTLESASNFSIIGNPLYSELSNSIVFVNFNCIGASLEVCSILNGTHDGIVRILIWGTVLDTLYIDPYIQVDYIQFIIPGLKEKIISVGRK